MEKWMVKNIKAPIYEMSKELNINPIITRLLINRNVKSIKEAKDFLHPNLKNLGDPFKILDMKKAISIISEAISNNELIGIFGDYDADGVVSTYMLYSSFFELGGNVTYAIPHRVEDGYGINKNMVLKAYKEGIKLIVTCDNGISAFEAIEYAKEIGMKVIVTDHHEITLSSENKEILPNADAILNPKRSGDNYTFKKLCGAGVALKLVEGLFAHFNKKNWGKYIEFAAIATVCDVVDLQDENRIIVYHGLKMLNNTTNLGMKALIKEVGLSDKNINAYHLGFIIGPSINASGRLEKADYSLKLFLSQNENEAFELAEYLHRLNIERQKITSAGIDIAIEMMKNYDKNLKVIVLNINEVHESIAGIVAGRIKEKYYLPCIILTKVQDGLKGSGRSIEEYNMFDELSKVKYLMNKFGGHAMAAGLSIDEDKLAEFIEVLNNNCTLKDDDIIPTISIDTKLSFNDISFELYENIKMLEPYGKSNPKPLFAEKCVSISKIELIGKNKNVIKMLLKFNNIMYDSLIYDQNILDKFNELSNVFSLGKKIDIVFTIDINEYMGKKKLQLIINSYRPS